MNECNLHFLYGDLNQQRIQKGQSKMDNPEKLATYKCRVHKIKKNKTKT
jgi:hypothetical protein